MHTKTLLYICILSYICTSIFVYIYARVPTNISNIYSGKLPNINEGILAYIHTSIYIYTHKHTPNINADILPNMSTDMLP